MSICSNDPSFLNNELQYCYRYNRFPSYNVAVLPTETNLFETSMSPSMNSWKKTILF